MLVAPRESGVEQVVGYGFVYKHQCIKSDMDTYKQPAEEKQQQCCVGESVHV